MHWSQCRFHLSPTKGPVYGYWIALTDSNTGSGASSTSSIAQISVCTPLSTPRSSLVTDPLLVAVQNYITAILVFLVVEMLMTWGFYGQCPQI